LLVLQSGESSKSVRIYRRHNLAEQAPMLKAQANSLRAGLDNLGRHPSKLQWQQTRATREMPRDALRSLPRTQKGRTVCPAFAVEWM
jgi:hypothetical protein